MGASLLAISCLVLNRRVRNRLAADDVAVLIAVGGDPGDEEAVTHGRLLLIGNRLEHGLGGDVVTDARVALDLELGVGGDCAGIAGVGEEFAVGCS